MKKLILILPIIAFLFSGFTIPDENDIISKTINNNSPYYYPNLMARYMAGDTTLTLEDYHYLYYGYTYTKEYRPLESIPAKDEILRVFDRNGNKQPNYEDMLKIIDYAQQVIKSDPFSPSNINYLIYAYGSIGDTINEKIYYDKFEKIINTIDNSGSGKSENSPKHVLMFSHANDFVTAKGMGVKSSHVVSNKVEYIFYKDREKGDDRGMYFDYSRVYLIRPDEIPQKKRSWSINSIPIGKNKEDVSE